MAPQLAEILRLALPVATHLSRPVESPADTAKLLAAAMLLGAAAAGSIGIGFTARRLASQA